MAAVDPAMAPDEILAEADRSLYEAKCRRGRIESVEALTA